MKVLIVPLSAREEFDPIVQEVCASFSLFSSVVHPDLPLPPASRLRKAGVFSRVDDSNVAIGRRYSRNDELGTPYGITIDFACEFCLCTLNLFNLLFSKQSKIGR
jgi:glycyl-tRNA synthetase